MALPRTKEEALQQMRLTWLAFLMSIPLYIYAATIANFEWLHFRNAQTVFDVFGILDLLCFVRFRISRYPRMLGLAQQHPEDMHTVRRWTVVWTMLLSFAEAEAVFGVCSQIENNALKPALPFYALAFALLLSLWPRHIWEPGITPTKL
jgi:hypothetical protein